MNLRLFPQKPRTRKALCGWTLVEMMIVVALCTLMLASIAAVSIFMARTLDATANYAELDRQSRIALDKLSSDIRQCGGLTNFSATGLWFTNQNGSMLAYTWDTAAQTLNYTNEADASGGVLLKGCTYWKTAEFTHDPAPNTTMTFLSLPSTNVFAQAALTKVIVIDWVCKKTNYLTLTDSESVQTAKIVLRN
jgi:Tfp pilus assembly protein PilW